MIKKLALLTALSLALPALAQAQLAEVSCDDSARLEKTLVQTLGAKRTGTGLRDPETLLEIWVAERSGDWLLVQTYTNGTSCIVAMGEHWQGAQANPA